MALAGYRNATAASGTNWTTPSNATASDDSYATYNTTTQDFLALTTFGFSIPTNAIIRGFEVSVEGNGDSATAADRQIEVFLTKDGSASVGTGDVLTLNQTTDTVQVTGGATDLWGTVWDVAEINTTTFGVLIRDNDTTAAGLDIDHVMLRVYYDEGIRGEWDVDYDDIEIIHIDSYLDYDGGAGGTAPADEDVLFDVTSGATATVIGVADASVLAFGTLVMGEQHAGDFADADSLEVCSYVTFDAEANGGVSEADIGGTFTASGSGTRTGTIRHVRSDGSTGTIWWDPTGQGGTAVVDNDTITIDGTSRTVTASAAETANAWTGTVNGAQIETTQGYLDYDAETVSFESTSGSGRIRDTQGFQHNMCVWDSTTTATPATAMVVDDFEDPNATDTGRLFLIDVTGTFGNDNTIVALEELDYTSEQNGGFAIGDTVTGQTSTETGVIRRMIDNGTSGTLYLSAVTGAFTSGENLQVSATTRGVAGTTNFHRVRVGSATIDGTLTTSDVQWPVSHLYSDIQDQIDELLVLDDAVPMSAQVLDQQYTGINSWLIPFFSTRRLKKGALNEITTLGGGNNDSVYTNYFHLGSLFSAANIYIEQVDVDGNRTVLEQFWDPGPHDVLLRNRNKNLLVAGGTTTHFIRPFNQLYDFFQLSPVGLRNPVPLNTANDSNNATAYTTVRDTAVYHGIEMAWAAYTIAFDTGSGTISTGDVAFNSTANQAGMVARVPDSVVSGSDLHLAANGQDFSGWGDGETLDLLDYVDFDGQVSQFSLGQIVEAGGGGAGGPTAVTIRWIQQFGASRGRIWFSNQAGANWTDNEIIRPDGGGSTIATCDGAQVTANTWTALTNGATPETSDNTVLKDIGNGTNDPYNVVFNLNGATVQEFYEFIKFITEERAGSTTDPGTLLYPNNVSYEGRLYRQADSAYPAAGAVKVSPFGTFAGGQYFGARGVFIENMDAGDVQAYQLIDANNTTRTPPNFQSVSVTGLSSGDRVAVYRRAFTDGVSLTYNDNDGTGNSEITRGAGDFIRDGHVAGETIEVVGTTSNNGTYTVTNVAALTITLEGIVLTDEGPVSSDLLGSAIDKETLQGAATGNDLGDGDFVVQETIPSDYPSTGTIVVVNTNGSEIYEYQLAYTSFTASTFTLSGTLPQNFDGDARVYVPLILTTSSGGTEAQTIVFDTGVGAFPIKTRVRQKGIIPFEVDGSFSSSGVTVAAIRSADTIVE